MDRVYFKDRMHLLGLAFCLALLVILVGWALVWYELFYDEGVRFGEQIAREATELRGSRETERVFTFRPLFGTHQHYWIGIGAGPQSGLSVRVEHGHGGSTSYHRRFVSVPNRLEVNKDGEPAQITLRKSGAEVKLVVLR